MLKTNKIKFFMLLTMAFLCIPGNMQAMNAFKQGFQQLKQGFTWKTAATASLAGALTIGNLTCSAAPLWNICNPFKGLKELYTGTTDKKLDFSVNVDEHFKKSIHEIFKRSHLPESLIEKVKIKPFDNSFFTLSVAAATTLNNYYLFVPKDLDLDPTNVEKYNKSVAIIQHESEHLKNRDSLKSYIVAFALPLITQSICLAARKFSPIKITSPILKNSLKIPCGLIKGYGNTLAFFAHRRYQEQCADDAIENNIEILKAHITSLKEELSEAKSSVDINRVLVKLSDNLFKKIHYQLKGKFRRHNLHGTLPFFLNIYEHPASVERIKRAEQRIEALKQKGDPEAFRNPLDKEQDPKS